RRAVPFDAPLAKLAQNPLNRREQDDPEVQEMAVSLKQGQEQIATVVTREAFLEAYPDEEENVPVEAEWVMWKGNRRLAGATLAGLDSLEVMLAPDVRTAAAIEDGILHENIHRKDLSPLWEGELFLSKMKRENMSAREVAKWLGKPHGFVVQRVGLVKNLIPELKKHLRTGLLTFSAARKASGLGKEDQARLARVLPLLAQLIPAYQEMALAGYLDEAAAADLGKLSEAEQWNRFVAEKGEGGYTVSTPGEVSPGSERPVALPVSVPSAAVPASGSSSREPESGYRVSTLEHTTNGDQQAEDTIADDQVAPRLDRVPARTETELHEDGQPQEPAEPAPTGVPEPSNDMPTASMHREALHALLSSGDIEAVVDALLGVLTDHQLNQLERVLTAS
ncbi:ParB/RepB/Spo0J family partition protein, partial [Amycolatopsis sp. NPDC059020]|uniref:ParB/RepB/Spo0J family partition protein n=1 Tax=Amycolatopsis sp. NPDC059020 TaxID=3346703 RepID=UPI0036705E6A